MKNKRTNSCQQLKNSVKHSLITEKLMRHGIKRTADIVMVEQRLWNGEEKKRKERRKEVRSAEAKKAEKRGRGLLWKKCR